MQGLSQVISLLGAGSSAWPLNLEFNKLELDTQNHKVNCHKQMWYQEFYYALAPSALVGVINIHFENVTDTLFFAGK